MALRTLALQALCEPDTEQKLALAHDLQAQAAILSIATGLTLREPAGLPGRPARPVLIDPSQVPQRSVHTPEGRAALIHAICHIEFNAINLALDAVWRFAGMPEDFYRDWLRVAFEEAYHFSLLHTHLQTQLGHVYGDFPAHDGLWAMCEKTKNDITARMALVPRTLEARGLDATPLIQTKLRKAGTPDALAACGILDIILRDEIGHVAIGNRWYRWLCEREGVEPVAQYRVLARRHQAPRLKGPFNTEARLRAGFSAEELTELTEPVTP
ncbi:ferritin-like domain-containing protein [Ottowia testudinis]|uniref:Ferritin-like domain-containing protein n=1 Tax=Ottowia testudinis TaxID=2816950 RepID=A0A975CKW9_9BURK|nr:ferritin-like domain-containing protein [Ottowia testudinis]QTD46961.1 ferritin-like domain-containing protein [Ottowia testudinis]